MNMTAIRYGDDIIVVDCGMMFPDAELLGVDLVMPDLTFLKENQEQVRALILTHGHEDHIGAVPYFLSEIDVPVYGTAFTLALVERRLEEYDLEEEPRLHPGQAQADRRDRPVQDRVHPRHALHRQRRRAGHHHAARRDHPHRRFQGGPHPHRQRAFRSAHPGRLRQARRAAAAFRFHQRRPSRATPNPSAPSARAWRRSSTAPKGRVVVSCFSSSIHRIQLVLDLAQEFGRRVAVIGRSMVLGHARSRIRSACWKFPTASCCGRRTPWTCRRTKSRS